MRTLGFQSVIGILCLAICLPAGAASTKLKCTDIFSTPFWQQQALFVNTPDGRMPITLSIDSEVAWAEVVKFIRKFPEIEQRFNQAMGFEIAKYDLKVSANQMSGFVLRRGVDSKKAGYFISELSPWAIERLRSELGKIFDPYAARPFLQEAYTRLGWHELEAGVDGELIENRHKTFEVSPRRFRFLVEDTHKKFGKAQTHFHVGIPASIGGGYTLRIAQIIESRVVLTLATEGHSQPMTYSGFSTLSQGADFANFEFSRRLDGRGPLKIQLNEFKSPMPMHNLEIREYLRLENGFTLVESTTNLVQNYLRLKKIDVLLSQQFGENDPISGNLVGALEFAGQYLGKSIRPGDRAVGKVLLSSATRIGKNQNLTPELRDEVAKIVVEHDVDARLANLDLYLEPSVGKK